MCQLPRRTNPSPVPVRFIMLKTLCLFQFHPVQDHYFVTTVRNVP